MSGRRRVKRRPERGESSPQENIFVYEVTVKNIVVRESDNHSSKVVGRLEKGTLVKIDMETLTGKRALMVEPLKGWVSLWSAAGPILKKVKKASRRVMAPDRMSGVSRGRRHSASSVSSEFSAVSDIGDLEHLAHRSTNIDHDMTSNPYASGLEVEVFSKTKKRWLPGTVVHMSDEGVQVKYANKKKWFLFNSKSLRTKSTDAPERKKSERSRMKRSKNINLPDGRAVLKWTREDVCDWMSQLEGGQFSAFTEVFRKNDIGGRELTQLTKRDLRELGMINFSLRDQFFKYLLDLTQGRSKAPEPKTQAPERAYTISDLLEPLPEFSEVDEKLREGLLLKKIDLCCVIVHKETTPRHNVASKRKKEILMELVHQVSETTMFNSDDVVPRLLNMISINIFRELPVVKLNPYDHEEEETYADPNWENLHFVYELFHRFVLSFTDANLKILRKHLSTQFLYKMILTFVSEDARERDYLKTILHRIYGKFMYLRSYIRKTIGGVLMEIIYERRRFAGVAELLEILGSIINGFAVPLKEEHKQFLQDVLTPLHQYSRIHEFHQHLTYCVTQFLEKDSSLCGCVLRGLIRYWPVTSSQKEVLFLGEVEEVLELTPPEQFETIMVDLFHCLKKSMTSTQFQVAERALFLWNNDVIVIYACDHRKTLLPIVYPALEVNCTGHWNTTVQNLTFNVIKMFMEMDSELFEKIQSEHANKNLARQSVGWEEMIAQAS